MINIKKLNKIYNLGKENQFYALKEIDISIEKGEMVAITGPSGAGKSTLLHIIGFLDDFNDGEYYFDDVDVNALNDKKTSQLRGNEIGIVMQDFGLLNNEKVYSNVELPLFFSRTKLSAMRSKVEFSLKKLGIYDLKNKKVNTLSGGQKQKVAIARAIVNEPSLILADEPTGSLDNKSSKEIMNIFREINSYGTTVLIVTHDDNIAHECDRIINIEDGHIISNNI